MCPSADSHAASGGRICEAAAAKTHSESQGPLWTKRRLSHTGNLSLFRHNHAFNLPKGYRNDSVTKAHACQAFHRLLCKKYYNPYYESEPRKTKEKMVWALPLRNFNCKWRPTHSSRDWYVCETLPHCPRSPIQQPLSYSRVTVEQQVENTQNSVLRKI